MSTEDLEIVLSAKLNEEATSFKFSNFFVCILFTALAGLVAVSTVMTWMRGKETKKVGGEGKKKEPVEQELLSTEVDQEDEQPKSEMTNI